MLTEKKEKIGVEKHVCITDVEANGQIERIMELPEYKSFNRVVNDALFYGLPVLCEKLFGKVELSEDDIPPSQRQRFGGLDREF